MLVLAVLFSQNRPRRLLGSVFLLLGLAKSGAAEQLCILGSEEAVALSSCRIVVDTK